MRNSQYKDIDDASMSAYENVMKSSFYIDRSLSLSSH